MDNFTIDVLEGQPAFILDETGLSTLYNSLNTTSFFSTSNADTLLLTYVRTTDGEAVLDNIRNAKKAGKPCYLKFRHEGMTRQIPILAGRKITTEDGDTVVLWVRHFTVDNAEVFV